MASKRNFYILTGTQKCLDEQLKKILHRFLSKKLIIDSDFFSELLSIKNRQVDNPLVIKLLNILNLMSHTKKVIFCRILSHKGIQGNNKAYLIAKSALKSAKYGQRNGSSYGIEIPKASSIKCNPF